MAVRPNTNQGLLIQKVLRSQTTTHQIQWDSHGRVVNSSQMCLPDKTQHSLQTYIHVPGGIGIHSFCMRATEKPTL
jgi:hypothetical protein